MFRVPTLAILLAGLVQTAAAENPASFEWTKAKFDLVATGDAGQGKKLAKKFKCKKCHNKNGISDDEDIPSIAGQRATYTFKQLHDFKAGVREDDDMKKTTKKMTEEDMVHLSAWFASLERAPMVGGDPLLEVKVCDSCHEKDVVEKDNRIEVAPILIGQIRQYLEASMVSFKDAGRDNDLYDRMQSVTHKLTDDEIKRLARYYGAEDLPEE
jgi:cytochrome c553